MLNATDLEKTYDLIAEGIDGVGPRNESLFLGKLCLLLANQVGDMEQIQAAVRTAESQLRDPSGAG